jgi:glutaredoxin
VTVTLYTQPGCGPCAGVKSQLDKRDVKYDLIDIREDPEAAEFVRANGGTGTPFLVLDDGDSAIMLSRVSDMMSAIRGL